MVDTFKGATLPWLREANFPVVRLAFGAIVLTKTETRTRAYEVLKGLLKSVTVDPEEMRDLLYRVNWPATSRTVPDLKINRLTNWSAIIFLVKLFALTGTRVSEPDALADAVHAVRLEMDHNSHESRSDPFDRQLLAIIYEELVELALENATKGEKP